MILPVTNTTHITHQTPNKKKKKKKIDSLIKNAALSHYPHPISAELFQENADSSY
jgi:hypothetical protein